MSLNPVVDPTQPPVQHSTLSPAVQALADEGVQRSYRKGAIIVSEGDAGDTLFILLQGSVRTYGTDADGREVTYGTIPAPNYFGEMSLDGGARSARDRKSTRLNSSHLDLSRMPSSA